MYLLCRQRMRSYLHSWQQSHCYKIFWIWNKLTLQFWFVVNLILYWMFSAVLFLSIWYVKFCGYQKSILICLKSRKKKTKWCLICLLGAYKKQLADSHCNCHGFICWISLPLFLKTALTPSHGKFNIRDFRDQCI